MRPGDSKSPKGAKNGSKRKQSDPTVSQRVPKVSQREPKVSQREPQRNQREPKGSPKGAKREPKGDQNDSQNRFSEKGREKDAKRASAALRNGVVVGAIIHQTCHIWVVNNQNTATKNKQNKSIIMWCIFYQINRTFGERVWHPPSPTHFIGITCVWYVCVCGRFQKCLAVPPPLPTTVECDKITALWFIVKTKAIDDIGTKFLYKACFGHNSTHRAP